MPTGYTAIIDDKPDTTFSEFLWRCARGMGAFLHMRDEPLDAPLQMRASAEFTGFERHRKELAKAKAEIARLKKLSPKKAAEAAAADYERSVREWDESRRQQVATYERYLQMAEQAKSWQPPTPEHQGLKDFMLDQLETGGYRPPDDRGPEKLDGEGWRAKKIAEAERDVKWHAEAIESEKKRDAERTAWIRALAKSVKPPKRRASTRKGKVA